MNGVLSITKDDDTKISILVGTLIAYNEVIWALNALVNRFISVGVWWDSAIVIGVLLIVVLYSANAVIRRQDSKTVILYVFFAFCFIVSILLNLPGASHAKEVIFTFFFTILPYYIVGHALYDYNKLQRVVIFASKVALVSSIIWLILFFLTNTTGWSNGMAISYSVLPSACILFYAYFADKTFSKLLWAAAGFLTVVFMGTRGPILILVVYIVCLMLHFSHSSYRFIVCFVLLAVGLLVYTNWNSILTFFLQYFSVGDTTNAAFYKLIYSQDISNGRTLLYEKVWEFCKDSIVLGHGIFGEWSIIGGYAHLMPLEFIVHYGVILGPFAFVYVVIRNIRVLNANKYDDFAFCFVLAIVFAGFFKLLISGSYLQEPYFWLLLGMSSPKKKFGDQR